MRKKLSILTVAAAFIFICTFRAAGMECISSKIEQDGAVFSFDHVFTDTAALTFTSAGNITKGNWSVDVLTKNGEYETVCKQNGGQQGCVFNPSETSWDWNNAMRLYDSALNRDLFELRVRLVSEDGLEDTKHLELGLLPARPEISNVTFTYEYDWEKDEISLGSSFSFVCKSSGATMFTVYETQANLFSSDNIFFILTEYFKSADEVTVKYDDEDWGVYFNVSAENQYGYVDGDTICTTSYITDKAILKRIDELKALSGIEKPSSNEPGQQVKWDNATLSFQENVKSASVYNVSGTLIEQERDLSSLDLSHLPCGMYVVAYQYTDNSIIKLNKIKIIKK